MLKTRSLIPRQVIRNPSCPKGAVLENNLFCLIICVLQVAQIHLVSTFSYSISLHLLLLNGRVLYFFSSIAICNSSTSLEASMQSFLFKKEKSNSKTGFPTVINLSGFCRHARIGLYSSNDPVPSHTGKTLHAPRRHAWLLHPRNVSSLTAVLQGLCVLLASSHHPSSQ